MSKYSIVGAGGRSHGGQYGQNVPHYTVQAQPQQGGHMGHGGGHRGSHGGQGGHMGHGGGHGGSHGGGYGRSGYGRRGIGYGYGYGRRGIGYGYGYPYAYLYSPYGADYGDDGDDGDDQQLGPQQGGPPDGQDASVGWRGGWGWDWRRRRELPYAYGYPYAYPEVIQGEPGHAPGIRPRNLLVEDPGPDRAGREVLPMSTGVAILPTQSAQITARPQRVAFRPERVFISAAGTSGGAADWVVNDIKIGNRSQFSQSGDVPGDMFATNAIDGFVSFETAQTAMDVVMVVTYIGLNESGVPFFASIVGTAAI